jgi:UDP-N-acetylmuramate dehydrogenase
MNIEEKDLNSEQQTKLKDFIVHGKVSIGKLVENLDLKGLKVGGAMVSYDHGNVILNVGGAKAKDVIELERTIKDKVMAAYGIILRPEVTKIGEF